MINGSETTNLLHGKHNVTSESTLLKSHYCTFRNWSAKYHIFAKQLFFTYPDKIQISKLLLLNASQDTLVGCDGIWTLFVGMLIHAIKFISWFHNHNSKRGIWDDLEVLYLMYFNSIREPNLTHLHENLLCSKISKNKTKIAEQKKT
jgi:hypothetical protein